MILAPLLCAAALLAPPSSPAPSIVDDGRLAQAVAAGLHGLALTPEARSLELAAEIGRGNDLLAARRVSSRLVQLGLSGMLVSCRDGRVELRGTVDGEERRRRAERIAAATEGVGSVTNSILVAGEVRAPEPVAPPAEAPAATQGPFAFLTPGGLAGRDIRLEIRDGIVDVRGEVSSEAARGWVTRAAQRVPGVRAVRNQVAVREVGPEEARRLALLVQRRLEYSPVVGPVMAAVLVTAPDGIVRLEGRVRDAGQRAEAERLVRAVDAAFAVDNRLVVDGGLTIVTGGDGRACAGF